MCTSSAESFVVMRSNKSWALGYLKLGGGLEGAPSSAGESVSIDDGSDLVAAVEKKQLELG